MKKLATALVMCAVICVALVSCAAATQHTLTAGNHKVTFDVSTPDRITQETRDKVYVSAYDTYFTYYLIRIGDTALIIAETTDPSFDGLSIDTEWDVKNGFLEQHINCKTPKISESSISGNIGHIGSCYSFTTGMNVYASAFKIDRQACGAIISLGEKTTFEELIDSLKIT